MIWHVILAIRPSLQTESYHDVKYVNTGGIARCRYDNPAVVSPMTTELAP